MSHNGNYVIYSEYVVEPSVTTKAFDEQSKFPEYVLVIVFVEIEYEPDGAALSAVIVAEPERFELVINCTAVLFNVSLYSHLIVSIELA